MGIEKIRVAAGADVWSKDVFFGDAAVEKVLVTGFPEVYCKTPYLPYGKKRKLSLSSFKNDLFILHLCGNCLFWWFPS